MKKGEEGKDEERCTSTCYVTLVMDDPINVYDIVYVTEAVVVVSSSCCRSMSMSHLVQHRSSLFQLLLVTFIQVLLFWGDIESLS